MYCKERVMLMHRKVKPSIFHPNAGNRSSAFLVLWCLLGCLLMIHLISLVHRKDEDDQIRLRNLLFVQELEELEEEESHLPPPRGRGNPRASNRWESPRHPSIIDEFLNESSELRPYFFPDSRSAIGPTMPGNDSMYFYPGRLWLDTDGNPIQAHGGGILFDEKTKTYFWYGENKDGPTYRTYPNGAYRVDIIGISCYSSKDLWAWKNEGIVLPGSKTNVTDDLRRSNVLERPKVIYNDKTGTYVMWMHIDDANYTKASVGVAVSEHPAGPFKYLHSKRPHNSDSRDMTIFKDDDGKAYLVYSSEKNSELHAGLLTDDYLDVTNEMREILVGEYREAPALFKHEGMYYMISSGCTGWAPNGAMVHAAEAILGPWEAIGNPCIGSNEIFSGASFFAQSTFVIPVPGLASSFIFMADRWNPSELKDSRYVWLPLTMERAAEEEHGFRVSIFWHRRWRLPDGWRLL